MGRAGRSEDGRRRRKAAAAALTALATACFLCARGPEAGVGAAAAAAAGIDYTLNGNYKVRGVLNGVDMGIGLYDAGSMRVLPEARFLVAIIDEPAGESWLYDRSTNITQVVPRESAALLDNFMPARYLEPYFQLESYWSGLEFKMTTEDGRTFRVTMDGPNNLPTLFEVSGKKGVLQRMEWTYFKVGEVSGRNFAPPDGTILP